MFAQTFRNTLIASTLLVSASLLAGPAAFAAETGELNVGGNIATVSAITFTQPAAASEVTLQSATSFAMGSVHIQNNDPQGWTLEVSSANNGQLQNQSATPASAVYVEYTTLTITEQSAFGVAPASLAPTSAPQVLVNADYTQAVAAAPVTGTVTAMIESTGTSGGTSSIPLASLPAGNYTDTLTFTLASKL